MGLVDKSRRSHHGSEDQRRLREAGPITLPIFGKNFEGSGVHNWKRYSGAGGAQPRRFGGESDEGWGTHVNFVVDCLNVVRTARWSFGVDADGWSNLWNMEATPEEIVHDDRGARLNLIERLVVQIRLEFHGIVFIPNPDEWAIYIPSYPWDLGNVPGFPVPRPATDPGGADLRRRLAAKRKYNVKHCK